MTRKQLLFGVLIGAVAITFAVLVFGSHEDRSTTSAKPQEPTPIQAAAAPAAPALQKPLRKSVKQLVGNVAPQKRETPADPALHQTFLRNKSCYGALVRTALASRDCSIQPDAATQAACKGDVQSRISAIVNSDDYKNNNCAEAKGIFKEHYRSVAAAAASGDTQAQLCYLGTKFLDFDREPGRRSSRSNDYQYTPDDIAQFQVVAPTYIQDAFSRGDWGIVEILMADAKRDGGLMGSVVTLDSLTEYQMNRLLRLGATGQFAADLDSQAETLLGPNLSGAVVIDSATRDAADAWARDIYAQYFTNSGTVTDYPQFCN